MDRTTAIPGELGLRLTLALTGVTATVGQIVLMRELIVVFNGNELTLGLMLACWLVWTAAGSSLLGRVAGRFEPRRAVAALLLLEAAIFPGTIFAVRGIKALFHPAPGELLGPAAMLAASATTLSAFCLCSGCIFAASSRLYAKLRSAPAARATSHVYLLEAAGAGAGGLLASLVLIRFLGAFDIAMTLAAAQAAAAFYITAWRKPRLLAAAALFAVAIPGFAVVSPWLESASMERLWHGFRVVATKNSVYGNLVVTGGEGSRTVYENGLVMFTVPDAAAAEESVHYALLEHPAPKRVLLIGGGLNGSITEAFRNPTLERLDYVELDPALIELAREQFGSAWAAIAADGRVRIHNADGRLFLKGRGERFDVIVVNLPEPQTAQLNRFYTVEFYREAARRLSPGGVLSFALRGSENYISPDLAAFLGSVNRTLREIFPEVAVLPGETIHFFAALEPGTLVRTADGLLARLRSRRLNTQYVREYFLPFRMTPDRVADLEVQIRPGPDTRLNRDFAPIAYYFGTKLWSTRFSGFFRRGLDAAAGVGFGRFALSALAALGALSLATGARRRPMAAVAAGAGGFTMMGLELLLLLGFQALHGYVYHELALLTAAFMAGMALGSWFGSRTSAGGPRSLGIVQIVLAGAPLLLLVAFGWLSPLPAAVVFPVLALVSGALGGWQFVSATRVYFFSASDADAGVVYAADLAGASVGAFALSGYVIPVFGFVATAILLAIVNVPPAVRLAAGVRRR